MEQNELEIDKAQIALEPMIDKLARNFTAHAEKPVRIIKDLQAPEVYADEKYLEEVLGNLDVYVNSLRKLFKDDPSIEIKTLRGVGLSLCVAQGGEETENLETAKTQKLEN